MAVEDNIGVLRSGNSAPAKERTLGSVSVDALDEGSIAPPRETSTTTRTPIRRPTQAPTRTVRTITRPQPPRREPTPRPPKSKESAEEYILREGINAAMKFYSKDIKKFSTEKLTELLGNEYSGAGASQGLVTALGALNNGADIDQALVAGGLSGLGKGVSKYVGDVTKEAAGNMMGGLASSGVQSATSGLLSLARGDDLDTAAIKSGTTFVSGYAKQALAVMLSKDALQTAGVTAGSAAGKAIVSGTAATIAPVVGLALNSAITGEPPSHLDMISAAGSTIAGAGAASLGGMAATGYGAIPALFTAAIQIGSGIHTKKRAENRGLRMTYDSETGKVSRDDLSARISAGGKAKESYLALEGARDSIREGLTLEAQRRKEDYSQFTLGMDANEKSQLDKILGKEYFNPTVSLESGEIEKLAAVRGSDAYDAGAYFKDKSERGGNLKDNYQTYKDMAAAGLDNSITKIDKTMFSQDYNAWRQRKGIDDHKGERDKYSDGESYYSEQQLVNSFLNEAKRQSEGILDWGGAKVVTPNRESGGEGVLMQRNEPGATTTTPWVPPTNQVKSKPTGTPQNMRTVTATQEDIDTNPVFYGTEIGDTIDLNEFGQRESMR